ncbi:hypothetical protein TWF481_009100 [Arthrobotrys musiformis]|uniref:Mid2 domain-containing protein n=1 Tax=Arthrobotrys musiformis TaxID=47236 RepID=A0AAV9W3Q5_9PEZI
MQHTTTLLLLLLSALLVSTQDPDPRPCFFPGGTRAPGYVACNNAATGHSACCRNNNQTTCFSTGLCYLERGFYERGACTDQSWQSDSCPGPCRDFRSSGQNILACADTTGSFCCGTGSNPSCCQNRDNYFTFEVGQIAFINGEPVSRTRTAGPATTATGTSTSSPTTEPQIIERTQTGVIAGMAAGIGVASVIAVAFAIMYFRERRKSKNSAGGGGVMKYESRGNGGGGRTYDEHDHYGHYAGQHDAGERESFMSPRGAWAPGGDGNADSPRLGAVIPPKYVPPERRVDSFPPPVQQPQVQPQQPQQAVDGGQLQGTPIGELPAQGNNIEGLSELAGTESRRY